MELLHGLIVIVVSGAAVAAIGLSLLISYFLVQAIWPVLIGLGGGLLAGLLFTCLRQLLDSKLRYPRTVQTSLGVPVLGVIPEQRKWRKLGPSLRGKSA